MASKLLSFIIIATSCHHFIGAMQVFRPLPVIRGDTHVSGSLDQVQKLVGYKHSDLLSNTNGARYPGPQELPRDKLVSVLPHDVFPAESPLDQVATQQIAWVKNKDYNPLSIDTKAEWEGIGDVYKTLNDQEQAELKNYMRLHVTRGSPKDQIDLIRVERYMQRVNEPIWWKADLVTKADRTIGEDLDLIEIGDILRFRNTDPSQQLTSPEVTDMFHQLHDVYLYRVDKLLREKPLNLKLLDQPTTNFAGQELLFQKSITQLKNDASQFITAMSPGMKEEILRVLYWSHEYEPNAAEKFAKIARKNLDASPMQWDKLLKENDWKESGKLLQQAVQKSSN